MVRPLSRVDTNIRPPVGGSNKGCSRYAAHFPPAFRPPPRAAPRRGACRPPAPLACGPCAPAAHRHPLRPIKEKGCPHAVWAVLVRQGLPAKSPCPMEIHQKGCLASEARQAVGTAPVVKVAPQWCMWSKRQRCPHVPRRAGLSTGSVGMPLMHWSFEARR